MYLTALIQTQYKVVKEISLFKLLNNPSHTQSGERMYEKLLQEKFG